MHHPVDLILATLADQSKWREKEMGTDFPGGRGGVSRPGGEAGPEFAHLKMDGCSRLERLHCEEGMDRLDECRPQHLQRRVGTLE